MKTRKRWIGRWLIAVAIVHTIFGVLAGTGALTTIVERGVFNSVGADALTGVYVWFLLFGAILALLGMAVDALEKGERFEGARSLGIGTGLMTLAGVVLMPVSGFWLAFPAVVGLMRRAT